MLRSVFVQETWDMIAKMSRELRAVANANWLSDAHTCA